MENQIILSDVRPKLADIGIVDFRYCAKKDYLKNKRWHHHDNCYEICCLQEGYFAQWLFSADAGENGVRLQEGSSGDCLVVSPRQLHTTVTDTHLNYRGYFIVLDPDCPVLLNNIVANAALLRKALESLSAQALHLPQSAAEKLVKAFRHLLHPSEENVFQACSLLSLFVMEAAAFNRKAAQAADQKVYPPHIQNAISFIRDHLLEPDLTLDTIAGHLKYSRAYTSTVFKNEVGMTLQEFVVYSKVKLACELLEKYPVTEVAAMLNFSSSQYFSNVFKKYMNRTPSQWKKRNGE